MSLEDDLIIDDFPVSPDRMDADEDDDRTEAEVAEENADRAEQSMMRSAGTVLTDKLISWLDNEIAATDSITAVTSYALSHQLSIEHAAHAFAITADLLKTKRSELAALREEYLKS